MRAWVFARRGLARVADDYAERLRGSGSFDAVTRAESHLYKGEKIEADVVFHDGSAPIVQYTSEERGVRCEYVDFGRAVSPTGTPSEAVRPEVPEDAAPHTLDYKQPWYTIYDPDGRKVGKATRDEAEARARLAALNGEAD